jgi:hypothetical protein
MMGARELNDSTQLHLDFFARILEHANALAQAHGGWRTHWVSLGDVSLELLTLGDLATEMASAFVPQSNAERIQRGAGHGGRTIRIRIMTTEALGATLPATMWRWDEAEYRSDRFGFTFDVNRRMLTAVDVGEREAVVWFTSDRVGAWERAAPARPIIDRLLSQFGLTMLHAGSLGKGDKTMLFAGPGGSGKSTLVRAGVKKKMKTVGDDFLLLLRGEPPQVAPLYRTVRLQMSSPSFDAASDRIEEDGFANDKALVLLPEDDSIAQRQQVIALAAMHVSGKKESILEPTSTSEVLRSLLPSSLILADRRPEAMTVLTDLARGLPSFRFAVGTDIDHALRVVSDLLEEIG